MIKNADSKSSNDNLMYEHKLEELLSEHINPEVSRNFDKKHFLERRKEIHDLQRASWLTHHESVISIVGSNGKGSTAHLLSAKGEQILDPVSSMPNPPVGLHTSPHLISPCERIRFNRQPIQAEELYNTILNLKDKAGELYHRLSYFELLTIASIYLFAKKKSPLQIQEAGLGGKLDATLAASPVVLLFTGVALEHTSILGTTHRAILKEKLGIMGERCRLLIARSQEEIDDEIIIEEAKNIKPDVTIHIYKDENKNALYNDYIKSNNLFVEFALNKMHTLANDKLKNGEVLTVWEKTLLKEKIPVNANQQKINIPGRMEHIQKDHLHFLFDAAHNSDAFNITVNNLHKLNRNNKAMIYYALLKERDPEPVHKLLKCFPWLQFKRIQAEGFASLPFDDSVSIHELSSDIQQKINEGYEWFMMLGSHRIYELFLNEMVGYKNS